MAENDTMYMLTLAELREVQGGMWFDKLASAYEPGLIAPDLEALPWPRVTFPPRGEYVAREATEPLGQAWMDRVHRDVAQFGPGPAQEHPGGPARVQVMRRVTAVWLSALDGEIEKQYAKYGPFRNYVGGMRLGIAALEDEVAEAYDAWRDERRENNWSHTRTELLQVAAVAMRLLLDTAGMRDDVVFGDDGIDRGGPDRGSVES